jgi:hypothetical protein
MDRANDSMEPAEVSFTARLGLLQRCDLPGPVREQLAGILKHDGPKVAVRTRSPHAA